MISNEKICPFCAELIKKTATKCKFCLRYIDNNNELAIAADSSTQVAPDSNSITILANSSLPATSSRSKQYDLNEPVFTGVVDTVTANQSRILQNNLTCKTPTKFISKDFWIGATTGIASSLVVAVATWFYWHSGSVLQEFIDLRPQYKQVSFFEEALKIKPIQVSNIENNGKNFTYKVKGCEFSVNTDENKNVVSYELDISELCPPFIIEIGGLLFDSKKTTLKTILNQIKDCYSYFFRVEYVIFLGNMYDPSYLNYLELSGTHVCNFRDVIFTFPENEGIAKWKSKILDDYGGSDNLPNDQRKEINSDRRYNKLAENLWADPKPSKILIK